MNVIGEPVDECGPIGKPIIPSCRVFTLLCIFGLDKLTNCFCRGKALPANPQRSAFLPGSRDRARDSCDWHQGNLSTALFMMVHLQPPTKHLLLVYCIAGGGLACSLSERREDWAVWWCWSWQDSVDYGADQQRCQSSRCGLNFVVPYSLTRAQLLLATLPTCALFFHRWFLCLCWCWRANT